MFCTTECWSCNDNSCEHYIDKTKLYFEYKKLQVENQNLKEKINHLLIDLNGESEYKSRNEKAIEYINTHYLNANDPELLNILQGSDL